MLRSIGVVIGVLGTAVAVARADGVGTEVTVGSSEATDTTSSSGFISDRLWGSVDAKDVLTVRAEGSFTRDAAATPDGWAFDDDSVNLFRFAGSLDLYPSEHVAIGFEANLGTERSTTSSASVGLQRATGGDIVPGAVDVHSSTSTWGVGADVEYDSAGESRFEWVAGVGVNVQTFTSFAQLGDVTTESGMVVDPSWIIQTCDARACNIDELNAMMDGQSESLRQVRISANGLGTIAADTDVGLGASYYLYTADPTKLGTFSLAALGRDQILGEGLHYAPVELTVRPNVSHRIGRVQLGSWFEYARYVADEGDAFAIGVRVQVRVGAFRVWLGGVGQQERSGPGDSPKSAQVSLGTRVRF
jgi:hypothetical protein